MAIKLLHIIGQLNVGGCEKQLLEMCRRMDKTKYELSVCYYTADKNALDKEFLAAGVSVYFIDKPALGPIRFFKKLCEIIRQVQPDIIHTWMYSPNFWGRLAGWWCGCRKFISSSRAMMMPLDFLSWCIERLTGKRTTWVVNSKALAAATSRGLRIPDCRMHVVYNAVDIAEQDHQTDRIEVRNELKLKENQPIILSVGRLTFPKNYPMLMRVAKKMAELDPAVRFIIAGHGEDESKLKAMISDLKLDNVILLGLRRDVARLLSAADVFFMCSRYEGFPNAAAEAMFTGLPVVCTRFAGADEVVQDGQTGYLVGIDDDNSATKRIFECLSNGQALATAAQKWARSRLSWERLLAEMDRFYECRPSGA